MVIQNNLGTSQMLLTFIIMKVFKLNLQLLIIFDQLVAFEFLVFEINQNYQIAGTQLAHYTT